MSLTPPQRSLLQPHLTLWRSSPSVSLWRALCAILCVLCFVTVSGCQLDAAGLDQLERGPEGYQRLAKYALDIDRPDDLRRSALRSLARERKYNELLTVIGQTSQLKDHAIEQMSFIAKVLSEYMEEVVKAERSPEQMSQVAELSFLVLSFQGIRDEMRGRSDLLAKLTKWSLHHLRIDRKMITPIKAKSFYTTPHNLLVALLLTANYDDGRNVVFEVLSDDLKTHLKKVHYVLRAHEAIHEVKIRKLTEKFAPILYLMAREVHENQPEKMNRKIVKALLENENLTMLKFLIEICRDQRLSSRLLEFTLDQVMEITQKRQYQSEIIPILERVIASQHAHLRVTFTALEWSWLLGKKNNLRELLTSIPSELKLPVSGTQMKQSVDRFCTVVLDQSKDLVRLLLQELIISLREQTDLWPARLIAVSCVERLYPDDFRRLMNQDQLYRRYYKADQHPISSWRSDRVVTLGDIITQYMNPRR